MYINKLPPSMQPLLAKQTICATDNLLAEVSKS